MSMRLPAGSPLRAIAVSFLAIVASTAGAATLPIGFTETTVASRIASPTAMALAPDGRIFVSQQGGRLRVIKNGTLLVAPFLTLTVDSSGERGPPGVAFDPAFAINQFVCVYYTVPGSPAHKRLAEPVHPVMGPDG
jgi:glucose/arabinose dehydrogenase